MKVSYDKESDILYIVLRGGPASDSEELDDDIILEYDEEGKIIGIEIFDARRSIGKVMAEEIAQHVKATAA